MSRLEYREPRCEYGWPHHNAYSEPEIRHFIGKSYSIRFNKDKFNKHHKCIGQWRRAREGAFERYVRRFNTPVIDENGKYNGRPPYVGVGTAKEHISHLPYAFKSPQSNELTLWFKSIVVNRRIEHPRAYAVSIASDMNCFLCQDEVNISPYFINSHRKVIYDLKGRTECVCENCKTKYNIEQEKPEKMLIKLIRIQNTLLKVSSKAIKELK